MPTVIRLSTLLAAVTMLQVQAASGQIAIQIAPDNQPHPDTVHRVANTTGHVVSFTITNAFASTGDVRVKVSCTSTGSVVWRSCRINGPILIPGESHSADVIFDVTAPGTGFIQMTADSVGGGIAVIGRIDITIDSATALAKPADSLVNVQKNQVRTAAFWVKNTTPLTEIFTFDSVCTGTGVSASCTIQAPSSRSYASNASDSVRVTYTSQTAGSTGQVGIVVRLGPTVLAQALTQVLVPNASVTPDGGQISVAASSNLTRPFVVKNIGPGTQTFTLAPRCTGAGIAASPPCAVNPTPMVLKSGDSLTATLSFKTAASGTGTIGVIASFGTALDTGSVGITVTSNPAPLASVVPQGTASGGYIVVPPQVARTQVFTVTNLNTTGTSVTYTMVGTCTGDGVQNVCTSVLPATLPLSPNTSGNVTVGFTAGAEGKTGVVRVQAKIATSVIAEAYVNVTASATTVTPKDGSVTMPQGGAVTQKFRITNLGPAPATYDLQAHCLVAGLTGCSVPSALTVASGATDSVNVTYTPATIGTVGPVSLVARVGTTPVDSGWVTVTVVAAGAAPIVNVASVNPGPMLMNGHCLAVGVGQASAAECGDLRVVHPLPAVRTMNVTRAPTLVYNSGTGYPCPVVGALVTLAASASVPDSVKALLKIGGVTIGTGAWRGNQWSPGLTRRITVACSSMTSTLATGVQSYTLEVTNQYAGGPVTTAITGQLMLVNRTASPFGSGWWLAGLEQWTPGTGVWVGGDGAARLYAQKAGTSAPNRVWGAPSITYPDTIREVGTEFVRQLPDSIWAFFNAAGRHVRTRNRLGHITTFAYDTTGKLSSVTLPPPVASPLKYLFAYDGSGHLQTVTAPGGRVTTVSANIVNGQVNTITDPGPFQVGFTYLSTGQLRTRTNRRGAVTTYLFDGGSKLLQVVLAITGTNIIRTLAPSYTAGLSGTAVDPAAVTFSVFGPRSVNAAVFTLDKYGQPLKIVEGYGLATTTLGRGDDRYPGLVTQLITPTGHPISAVYDIRGRITTSTEPSTSGAAAVTQYTWDAKWDAITQIVDAEGGVTTFGVNAANGNRTSQQNSLGQIGFGYNANNQLQSVTLPQSNPSDYGYDGLGNLADATTPMDFSTLFVNDTLGRTIHIDTPVGDGQRPGGRPYEPTDITYSIRNEELTRTTAMNGQSVTITNTYDAEGNKLSTSRTFSPNPYAIALSTSWEYDLANRITKQSEADLTSESRTLDEAGNTYILLTRRNRSIVMSHDGLNRMVSRSVPAETKTYPASQIFPATSLNSIPYSYTDAANYESYSYAADGQITAATNKNGTVSRGYYSNGLLQVETVGVQDAGRTGYGGHLYSTSFTYNKLGQRIGMTVPAALGGQSASYSYYAWGGLLGTQDASGNYFGFGYTPRGELNAIGYPGGFNQSFGYDADGRLSADNVVNGDSSAFPRYPRKSLRSFGVTKRNARGQIMNSLDAAPANKGQVTATYDGLGVMVASDLLAKADPTTTGLAGFYEAIDKYTYDGLGNILTGTEGVGLSGTGVPSASVQSITNTYNTLGQLTGRTVSPSTGSLTNSTYAYDSTGNSTWEFTTTGSNVTAERASFYSANDQLVAVDRRGVGRRVLEEYRYDALGRRTWVRQRTQCEPNTSIECYTSSTKRIIWDGSQELGEIQAPYDQGNLAWQELDAGFPSLPYQPAGAADPNPYFGKVLYGPSVTGVDQPLSVTRFEYHDSPNGSPLTWPTYSLLVFWDHRGAPTYGVFSTGAYAKPYALAGGQTSCPAFPATSTQRCVRLQWGFSQSAYDRNRGVPMYPSWHGSLVESKRDASGLEYKRNRVYDPATGRFTQEDPIGLAGGVNTYGYAGGDPVNFGDPFGLQARELTLIGAAGSSIALGEIAVGSLTVAGAAAGAGIGLVIGGLVTLDPWSAAPVPGAHTARDATSVREPFKVGNSAQSARTLWAKVKLLIGLAGTQGELKKAMDEMERVRKEQVETQKAKEKESGQGKPDPPKP